MKEQQAKKESKTIAWSAPEFHYIHNTANWYWVVGTIGFLLALMSYIAGNWSFAGLLALSTLMLMVLSNARPQTMHVSLSRKTLSINKKKYMLKNYESYRSDEHRDKLLLKSEKLYHPLTIAPLPHDAPKDKIVDLLEDELDMEEDETLSEPVIDIIMHRLGF